MKVASVNVQDNPDHPVPVVLAYLLRLRLFLGRVAVVCFQEVQDRTDKDAVRQHFPSRRFHHLHFDTPTPMVVSRRYAILDSGRVLAFKGEAGFSPNRPVVWADLLRDSRVRRLLRRIVRLRGTPTRVAGWHQINGAWNDKPLAQKARRPHIWHLIDHAARGVWEAADALGYNFIGAADQNRVDVPEWVPRQRWVQQAGIDKVMAIPARGRRVLVIARGRMRRHQPMDHPPIWAAVRFPRRLRRA